jgi:thioester reductase-like protein
MKEYRIAPEDMPATAEPTNLADIIRWRTENHGELLALTYLADGETETAQLTYRDIDTLARRAAAQLQKHNARSRAVILLFQPGPEFLIGFLACLYAGAKGVPLYPPDLKRLSRTLPRFMAIVEDCESDIILTTSQMQTLGTAIFEHAPQLAKRIWLSVDGLPADLHEQWHDPNVSIDEVAFLQYTSGSTGDPKGIEVTHRSLLLNFSMLTAAWENVAGETVVTWLPNFHDMGLIDGWLRPLYVRCHAINMPPLAFLKNPFCWLQAISKYRGAVSGAPNFAYELCNAKVTDEEIKQLDLSCWHTAYNGAEPVRTETVKRFIERFGPCGFRPEAFSPGYGLAEAALYVSSSSIRELPVVYHVSRADLENKIVTPVDMADPDCQTTVSVGKSAVDLLIVDPDSRLPLGPGKVGEVWLRGPSMASGYWKRPDLTEEVFHASLAGSGEGPYLRTGDLAFVRDDGELFIAGRRKDLIIIAGRNIYPQDVEQTAENTDPANLRPGCNAAFSVDVNGDERLVIVQEIQRRLKNESQEWANRRLPNPEIDAFAPELSERPDFDRTIRSIRGMINEMHGTDPYAIVLIKAGAIPKTSSGKIQRRACRDSFLKGGLDIIKEWRADRQSDAGVESPLPMETVGHGKGAPETVPSTRTQDTENGSKIRQWLRNTLSSRLSIPLSRLGDQRPFIELGLDSRQGIIMVGDLERWMGVKLSASILYDHPSIDQVVRHLDGRSEAEGPEETFSMAQGEPIAIVGIGCRFPGADGPDQYWKLLSEGVDAIKEIPPERWRLEDYYDPDPAVPGKMISRYGGFLPRIDQFDPEAFDITAREAARMDPQQRLLLEVAGEALENAGMTPAVYSGGHYGVFIGISSFDYGRHLFQNRKGIDAYYGTGAALSIAANRISYQFNLHGPSMAVDSACSSSLVAVHLAMASLRRGECSVAVAGGVNAILLPDINITFTKAGVLSPDGRCKAFDAGADGIVRAEGAGVVILKPLSKALADRDHIWAVLLGSAVNSDGRSNGIMAPNGTAQQRAVHAAYRDAGVIPHQVQYVEAHGTGTNLGDPIEVGALAAVVSEGRPPDHPCRIGSVKTNFGHLEAGAGIASLIKVALMLHRRQLVPTLHYQSPNPKIPFEKLGIQVQTEYEPWPAESGQALAGVSSFGFGGTNAHVVLKEFPQEEDVNKAEEDDMPVMVPLSARSISGLRLLAAEVGHFAADEGSKLNIRCIAQSASLKRFHGPIRMAVVARSTSDLHDRLSGYLAGKTDPLTSQAEVLPEASRRIVFVCPGQGGQWWAMGRDLLRFEPVFQHAVEGYDALFKPLSGWSIIDELQKDEQTSRVNDIEFTQPLLFAVQAGLWEVWRSLGVEPDAVVGHSMGEITAAYIAGKLDLEEAVRVVYHRGRLMKLARGKGTMASLEVPFDEAELIISAYPGRLSVAANNAPSSCVIAGERAAIEEIMESLSKKDVFCRELHVQVAGHCPDMAPLQSGLQNAAGIIPRRASRVPIISTVTGGVADDIAFDGLYWSRNLREPVRFQSALECLLSRGYRVFLELSPHPTLLNAITQTAAHTGIDVKTLYSLRRNTGERESILATAGALHTLGFPIRFSRFYPRACRFIPLPPMPFDRQHCWVDVPDHRGGGEEIRDTGHPLIANHVESPTEPGLHLFQSDFDLGNLPWVSDHRVQEHAVFPATGYIELIRAACFQAFGQWRYPLADVQFHRALIFGEISGRRVQTTLKLKEDGVARFEVYSRPIDDKDHSYVLHASGHVLLTSDIQEERLADQDAIRKRCGEVVSMDEHYRSYKDRSIDYRGAFHTVRQVNRRDGEALGTICLSGNEEMHFDVHPGLLDACLQVMGNALPVADADFKETFMPVGLERMMIFRKPGLNSVSHVLVRPGQSGEEDRYTADITLADDESTVWGKVVGLTVQSINSSDAMQAQIQEWLYQVEWEEQEGGKAGAPRAKSTEKAQFPETWLLFADRKGFASDLEKELSRAGIPCVKAYPGDSFRRLGEGVFEINPCDPKDPGALLDQCGHDSISISRAVYLWGLDAPMVTGMTDNAVTGDDQRSSGETISANALLQSQEAICRGLIHLMQALEDRDATEPPSAWVVTRNAEPVQKTDHMPALAQTTLWGLGRSLGHEFPRFWGGLIDMDNRSDAAIIIEEIARPGAEDQVAFRGSQRFVPRLLHRPLPLSGKKIAFRKDGAYLVTGGLGALGLRIAHWLVVNGAGRLILTGRTVFPERNEWEKMAASGDKRAEALLAMERIGARICVAAVDVCDFAAMRAVFDRQDFTPIIGIIHAAGIVAPKPAMDMTGEDLRSELRPKVAGAWVLHQLSQKENLDFFVLFSSASAIWGSKLLAGYGAANHFLDGLAHLRRRLGQTGLSVNWAMWGGGGMAVEGEQNDFLRKTGLRPMPPEKALFILEELIKADAVEKTVADIDWSLLKPLFEQEPRRKLLTRLSIRRTREDRKAGEDRVGVEHTSELLNTLQSCMDTEDRRKMIRDFVLRQTAEVLGIPLERLQPEKSLLSHRLDSLNANDLRGRLQSALPVKINVLSLLKGDSPEGLSKQVYEQVDAVLQKKAKAGEQIPSPGAAVQTPESEKLDDDIQPGQAEPMTDAEPGAILLTGATGFLGAFILAELLGRTEAKIHCLVKAKDDAEAMRRLRERLQEADLWQPEMGRRIVPVAGDLVQPRLGLTSEKWTTLAHDIDQIYHVGFVVNFLFSYEDLRPANVLSLIDILRLASSIRVKPVHFVSSFSVLLTKEYAGRPVGENDPLYPGEGGYREGKRACERLIAEARRRGLPISIYRPPFIGWHSGSGYYNDRDFLIKLIQGCLMLGSAPDMDIVFYIAPVDFVGSSIVSLAKDKGALNANYNILSAPQGIGWAALVDAVRSAGGKLEREPFARWRERIDQAGPQNPLHIFFPLMGENIQEKGSAVMELFHKRAAPSRIDLSAMRARLGAPSGRTEVDTELIRPFLERLKRAARIREIS